MAMIKMRDSNEDIKVTVLCVVYNQVSYIEKCLRSLVSQTTNFKYRVVVHDDASTDGSTQIILDYYKRYPSLIVPVIQKTNLYSQGISRWDDIQPFLVGDYLAMCEGDDYWIDDQKLQLQFDYMENNSDCSLSVHAVRVLSEPQQRFTGMLPKAKYDIERDYSSEELIAPGYSFFGTNSMFIRLCYLPIPDAFLQWGIGDYPESIYLSTVGRVHYHPRVMSVYRSNAKGSWSSKMRSIEARLKSNDRVIAGLRKADAATDGRYHDSFLTAEFEIKGASAIAARDWGALTSGDLGKWFNSQSLSVKIKCLLKCKLPYGITRLLNIAK